jgi:ATP-dependent DNA helicase RecG
VKSTEKTSGKKFGENRLKIISLMRENSKISIPEIADKVGISTTSIEKNIGYLKKQGIVKRIGPAKGGYWEVMKDE